MATCANLLAADSTASHFPTCMCRGGTVVYFGLVFAIIALQLPHMGWTVPDSVLYWSFDNLTGLNIMEGINAGNMGFGFREGN